MKLKIYARLYRRPIAKVSPKFLKEDAQDSVRKKITSRLAFTETILAIRENVVS